MEEADTLVRETEEALARPLELPHHVVAIATNLFLLSAVHDLERDPRVVALRRKLDEALDQAGLEGVLTRHLEYASRLATASGPLIYEEMHKLLSLCDEIHALISLGFRADEGLVRKFEMDVRGRFHAERRLARLAAEDRAEPWNRALWWYAENLDAP